MNEHRLISRRDMLLIAAMCITGALLVCVLLLARSDGNSVEIRVDGRTIKTIPLSHETEYVIAGVNGTNTVLVKDGCARVSDASCPDGLCMGMGSIRYTGQSVICLPNKVVISVTGTEADETWDDVDVITGGRR